MRIRFNCVRLILAILYVIIFLVSCVVPGIDLYPDYTVTGIFDNPYAEVDWDVLSYYDASFHTHTTLSDGDLDPHDVVDLYLHEGYKILAQSDHDSHHDTRYPDTLYGWNSFSQIGPIVGEGDWEDRDPDKLGMVAVEAAEVSRAHHINTFFMGYAGGHSDEDDTLTSVEAAEGLAVLNHPGRYDRSVQWYVDLIDQFDQLIGIEIFNRDDRYPGDRNLWDAVLYQVMPQRSVWGFGNDDMHSSDQIGFNRNILLLSELDEDGVRSAMENGWWYLFRPDDRGQMADVIISSIQHDQSSITVSLQESTDALISWITYDPLAKKSTMITTGATFNVQDMEFASPFVRAEIKISGGVIYTQPFGLEMSRNL